MKLAGPMTAAIAHSFFNHFGQYPGKVLAPVSVLEPTFFQALEAVPISQATNAKHLIAKLRKALIPLVSFLNRLIVSQRKI
jgi:hypothetical protein